MLIMEMITTEHNLACGMLEMEGRPASLSTGMTLPTWAHLPALDCYAGKERRFLSSLTNAFSVFCSSIRAFSVGNATLQFLWE